MVAAALGEHAIRDLNDAINKLLKDKQYWERRIRELGGGDYSRKNLRGRGIEAEGKELPGAPGYRYFGAAKELPGVRELFQQHEADIEARRKKRTRADIYRNITPDYYGFNDEDDEALIPRVCRAFLCPLAFCVPRADLIIITFFVTRAGSRDGAHSDSTSDRGV